MMFFNQLFEKYAEEMKKINTWKIFVSSKQLKGKTLPVYLPIWSKELAGLKLFFLCIYMDEKNVEDPFQGDMIVYTEAKVYRFIKLEKWSPFKVTGGKYSCTRFLRLKRRMSLCSFRILEAKTTVRKTCKIFQPLMNHKKHFTRFYNFWNLVIKRKMLPLI